MGSKRNISANTTNQSVAKQKPNDPHLNESELKSESESESELKSESESESESQFESESESESESQSQSKSKPKKYGKWKLPPNLERVLLGFLTFAIIIFMIYYIGPANFINNFAKLKLANLIFYYAVLYITIIFRIIDWKVILKGMDSNASYSTLYSSTGICIMVNEFVPLKLGDLIRIRIVKKREKSLSYGTIISSLTVFRVLDLIFMSLFAFLGFLTLSIFYSKVFMTDDNILNFGNGLQGVSNSPAGDSLLFNIRYILLGGLIISGLVIGIIILLITKTELILKITEKVSHKLRNALQKILLPFKKGILDLIKNKKLLFWALFIEGTTILIDATLLYIILPSFNLDVFILIAIISSLFTFLATVIPFTPGGWGIAELLGAGILKLFYPSYSMELLLSIILIEHFLRTFATIVIGASSYIVMNLKTEN